MFKDYFLTLFAIVAAVTCLALAPAQGFEVTAMFDQAVQDAAEHVPRRHVDPVKSIDAVAPLKRSGGDALGVSIG